MHTKVDGVSALQQLQLDHAILSEVSLCEILHPFLRAGACVPDYYRVGSEMIGNVTAQGDWLFAASLLWCHWLEDISAWRGLQFQYEVKTWAAGTSIVHREFHRQGFTSFCCAWEREFRKENTNFCVCMCCIMHFILLLFLPVRQKCDDNVSPARAF